MDIDKNAILKCAALSLAIKAACGTEINDHGGVTTIPAKLIEAAKEIEKYLKGTENV